MNRLLRIGVACITSFYMLTANYHAAQPAHSPLERGTVIAVMGDFGTGSQGERDVADMIDGWQPDCIIDTGDTFQDVYASFDDVVEKHYGKYLREGKFKPVLGNHDYESGKLEELMARTGMPGRYYSFRCGPVEFFMLDTSERWREDRSWVSPEQLMWLEDSIRESDAKFRMIASHNARYTSGTVKPDRLILPDEDVDAYIAGHFHILEGFRYMDAYYMQPGAGGGWPFSCGKEVTGAQSSLQAPFFCYDKSFSAIKMIAFEDRVTAEFYRVKDSTPLYTLTIE